MSKPVRLQLSRRKGFDLQALSLATNGLPAVNVARPSKWGNPFSVHPQHEPGRIWNPSGAISVPTTEDAVACFREMLPQSEERMTAIGELRGKNLACWCKNADRHENYVPCHADVLLSIANDIPMDEVISENLRRAKGEAAQ